MIDFKDFDPIPADQEKTILDLALENNLPLNHSCGGHGTCGTCRIIVSRPEILPERNCIEAEFAEDRSFSINERLACQTKALPNLGEIVIPNYKKPTP